MEAFEAGRALDGLVASGVILRDPEVRWSRLAPGLALRVPEIARVFRRWQGAGFRMRVTSREKYWTLLTARGKELEATAAKVGERVYQEKAQTLARRIEEYWFGSK